MTITYLNAELDTTKEHELFKITPLGFKVEITYNKSFFGDNPEAKKEILNYRTEIHHLPKSPFKSKDIAFESEILGEGLIRDTKHIESVVIKLMEG